LLAAGKNNRFFPRSSGSLKDKIEFYEGTTRNLGVKAKFYTTLTVDAGARLVSFFYFKYSGRSGKKRKGIPNEICWTYL